MKTLGTQIKQLREQLGWSQGKLGEMSGVPQQTIGSIEKDLVARPRKLPEIARALGVPLEQLLPEESQKPNSAPAPRPEVMPVSARATDFRALPNDVPVLGTAVGGSNGDFRFNGSTIDYVRRPPGVQRMANLFALYVSSTSMWPRFEEGSLIYVSNNRPPASGDDIVIELLASEDGEPGQAFIKRLLKRTPTKLVCEQFNPPMELEYDVEQVKDVFRIMTLQELLGI